MRQHANYSRTPITEALIDIQVECGVGVTVEDVRRFASNVAFEYPDVRTAVDEHVACRTDSEGYATAPVGFFCRSRDGKQVVQVRPDRFTFSRLAPYPGFEVFRNEARRLWSIFREELRPPAIKRVAVRSINRFNLPAPVDLKEYLRTGPELAPGLPQTLDGFFFQTVVPLNKEDVFLQLTEATITPGSPEVTSIVLDLNLFREQSVPQEDGEIWAFYDLLRDLKDDVFEACITERTRELIR